MKISAREIAEELYGIVNNSSAEAILMNDWLFDGSLPIPSAEVTIFVATHLLRLDSFLKEIGQLDQVAGVQKFISNATKFTVDQLQGIVEHDQPYLEASLLEKRSEK